MKLLVFVFVFLLCQLLVFFSVTPDCQGNALARITETLATVYPPIPHWV